MCCPVAGASIGEQALEESKEWRKVEIKLNGRLALRLQG
jgi:hypothetical protein